MYVLVEKKKSKIYVKKENCRKLCIVHYILCEKNPTSTRPPSAALEPVVRLHRQPLLSPPEHCQQCGAVPLFCSFFRSSWSSNIRLFSPKTVFPHLLAPPSLYHMAKSNILQFRSVQSLSCVRLFATTWTTARQASLSITNSGVYWNSCPVSRWCHPTISSSGVPFSSCLQSFPAPGFYSNESVLCIRWPKYWSFSFSISPSNEHPGLVSFRMDWLDLLAVQGTLKSLQHHSSIVSILWCLAFFIV